jgi:hypothetical protein
MQAGKPPGAEEVSAPASGKTPRVWILRHEKPEAVPVKTGLTDSHSTVVSGADLSEGLPVIIHAEAPKP